MTMVMTIDGLLSLPWTINSERVVRGRTETVELTVEGVPGFMVYGTSEEEAERKFWPSFRMFLQSYLDDGEQPPVPPGLKMRVARRLVHRQVSASPEEGGTVLTQRSNTGRTPSAVHYPEAQEFAGIG